MIPSLNDALLKLTRALPSGAATVKSGSIDMGVGTHGDNVAMHNFLLSAPLLTTSQLADAQTMKYDIIHSDNSDLSSSSVIQATVITQTGAGGAGAAAATFNYRFPFTTKRYVGFQVTKSGSGDASAATATGQMQF